MKRAIRTVVRLVAAGLILFGGMEIGLELTRHRLRGESIKAWHCVVGSLLIVGGVALFAVSSRIAERLGEDFEE